MKSINNTKAYQHASQTLGKMTHSRFAIGISEEDSIIVTSNPESSESIKTQHIDTEFTEIMAIHGNQIRELADR